MFSEALKIADRNTVKYMIEELQDRVTQAEENQKLAEEGQQKEAKLRRQAEEGQQKEVQRRKRAEENQKLTSAELDAARKKIAELEALLAKKQ